VNVKCPPKRHGLAAGFGPASMTSVVNFFEKNSETKVVGEPKSPSPFKEKTAGSSGVGRRK
jgi:hypothetical protein